MRYGTLNFDVEQKRRAVQVKLFCVTEVVLCFCFYVDETVLFPFCMLWRNNYQAGQFYDFL